MGAGTGGGNSFCLHVLPPFPSACHSACSSLLLFSTLRSAYFPTVRSAFLRSPREVVQLQRPRARARTCTWWWWGPANRGEVRRNLK